MTPGESPQNPDSLEMVELTMQLEAILTGEVAPQDRAEWIRKIRGRLAYLDPGGQFDLGLDDDDLDDDDLLAAFVRKLGPRGPLGRSGSRAPLGPGPENH
jgi:hypothetical protein